MNETVYRQADVSDAERISLLVQRALIPNTLPGWTSAAIEHLFSENSVEELREKIGRAPFAHVCVNRDSIGGFIISKNSRLLSLLAVDPPDQRRGIGSQLVQHFLAHIAEQAPELSVVEVNATEYSLPFYRQCGFYPISEFIEYEGCRFVRMGFWRKTPLSPGREC